MAFDVAYKAITANDIEGGDIVVGVTKQGNYQRLDQTDEFADPASDIALSGMYYDRFDNKGYY